MIKIMKRKQLLKLGLVGGVALATTLPVFSSTTAEASETTTFSITQSKKQYNPYGFLDSKYPAYAIGGGGHSVGVGVPEYNNVTHIPGWLHDGFHW